MPLHALPQSNQRRIYLNHQILARLAKAIATSGKDDATLSDETGLCVSTIRRLRLGLTSAPQFGTVAALAPMVGLKDLI